MTGKTICTKKDSDCFQTAFRRGVIALHICLVSSNLATQAATPSIHRKKPLQCPVISMQNTTCGANPPREIPTSTHFADSRNSISARNHMITLSHSPLSNSNHFRNRSRTCPSPTYDYASPFLSVRFVFRSTMRLSYIVQTVHYAL